MRNNRNIEWLAEKLGVDSEKLDIFITARPKDYFKQKAEIRMRNANCVQYYHPEKGIIYLGPNFIKIRGKIIARVGYESVEYIQKVQNTEKSEK